MDKVFIIMYDDGFDNLEIKKVFSTEEKAREYVKGKNPNYWWYIEKEVE